MDEPSSSQGADREPSGGETLPAPGVDAGTAPHYTLAEIALRKRARLLQVTRVVFVFVLLSAGMIRLFALGVNANKENRFLVDNWYLPIILALAMGAIFITIDLLTPSKKISTLVSVAVGLLVGVIATIVVTFVLDFLAEIYAFDKQIVFMFKVFLGICMCYLGVTLVLQTQDDVRLVIPYVEFAKQLRGPRPLLLDSSALIDARFADALQTGFFQAPIVIPRFVIAELQQLADSQDKLKRARGRRALDIVSRLQRHSSLDVAIDPTQAAGMSVDQALIELAARLRGLIVTTDSGLVRVAAIQGSKALNVNDLGVALRPTLAAGDTLSVRLVKLGEQHGQAVGYLPDGTMVVAEDGAAFVGKEMPLMVISTLQTSAGRLIFARTSTAEQGQNHADAAAVEPGSSVPPDIHAGESESPEAVSDTAAEDESADGGSSTGSAGGRPGPFPPRGPARPRNRFRNPRR